MRGNYGRLIWTTGGVDSVKSELELQSDIEVYDSTVLLVCYSTERLNSTDISAISVQVITCKETLLWNAWNENVHRPYPW